jgi:hypothetical protein
MPQRLSCPARCIAPIALAACFAATVHAAPGDLYVTSDASNTTRQYDGTTGAFQTVFKTAFAASGNLGIHFGATNNRVLIGHWTGGVEEFNATTGAYIKTYNPGGSTQWAGIYAPTGGVYIGDWGTNDVREYDANTGAFIRVVTSIQSPADMRLDGNQLYIASFFGGFVQRVNATSGAISGLITPPPPTQPNDIAVLPNGDILVTCMIVDQVFHFSPALAPLGSFGGSGFANPHGIEISPNDGNIYVVASGEVHVFDPVTFVELNPAWLAPPPGDKIVDLEFRPQLPTPALPVSWGAIKGRYR